MTISEYGNLFSLGIFFMVLLPTILLGIIGYGKIQKAYGVFISLPMIYMFYGDKIHYFLYFLGGEVFFIWLYYRFRLCFKKSWFYYFMLGLSILPIFLVKLEPYVHMHPIGFLGISYMGFRIWQLIIEIHDNHIQEFHLFKVLYFISFVPTLSSGPIDRYQRFCKDFTAEITGKEYWIKLCQPGLQKIFYGVIYKFAIANTIHVFWLEKIPVNVTVLNSVEYMYAYTLYLFFDFAGYSYFAIGTGYLLGFFVPENFNKPFLSKNMKEFWERWHISLSRWFGDYVFSRIVLNLLRKRLVKKQSTAAHIGYMITMLLMGCWHGFTAFYILYGLYQGIALVLSDKYLKSKAYRRHIKNPYYAWYSRFVCFHVIAFGLLIFSGYLIKF